jgi:membrane associated rhomboid family serine protease
MTDFRPSRFEVLPTVVKNLLIINGLMFLAMVTLAKMGIDLNDMLALHYWKSELFRPWQLVTHLFMHGSIDPQHIDISGGIMHLFSNMFALWMFGSILENVWGTKRFLTFYLVCGIGAALIHMGVLSYENHQLETVVKAYLANPTIDQFSLFLKQHVEVSSSPGLYQFQDAWAMDPNNSAYSMQSMRFVNQYLRLVENTATVGASGAVFGILFAFGYLFPNTLLYIYFAFPVKAKYFVAVYALFELFAGVRNSAGDNVAHFAHLGGMLVAYILLRIWNKRQRSSFF